MRFAETVSWRQFHGVKGGSQSEKFDLLSHPNLPPPSAPRTPPPPPPVSTHVVHPRPTVDLNFPSSLRKLPPNACPSSPPPQRPPPHPPPPPTHTHTGHPHLMLASLSPSWLLPKSTARRSFESNSNYVSGYVWLQVTFPFLHVH